MNQITENLWIGDIQDVRESDTSRFDRVITTCQDNVEDNVGCKYNYFNMSDGVADSYGGSSSYELFHEAALTLLGALTYGEDILIHCHAGHSRSVSVSIAALGVLEDYEFWEARDYVTDRRHNARPDELLEEHAEKFIENAP